MLFHAHRPQPITTNFSSWLLLASFLYSDIPSTSFKYATHVHAARSVLLLGTFSYLVFVLPGCGHVRACSTLSTCLLVFGDEYTTLCLLPCHLSIAERCRNKLHCLLRYARITLKICTRAFDESSTICIHTYMCIYTYIYIHV